MNWNDVCALPELQDLPYKIELNRFGQIVMSPANNQQGRYRARIGAFLLQHGEEGAEVISECSVDTSDGMKVPDVAWLSKAFWDEYGFQTPCPQAPELCVEIVSPSNSKKELEFKRGLYFEEGAREVWICSESGELRFYGPEGQLERSGLFPEAPGRV